MQLFVVLLEADIYMLQKIISPQILILGLRDDM